METIIKYYPHLEEVQKGQFEQLYSLYTEWNQKINVISRKDIENLYLHHVLHSLSISEVIRFRPGTRVMDLGCGGGFPGIPLAIMFPDVSFHLVDSIGKKLKVCDAVVSSLGLNNVQTTHARAESLHDVSYDFVVSRATMSLSDLYRCSRRLISGNQHNVLPNGIIALKGGNLRDELSGMKSLCTTWSISDFYEESYFQDKHIVHLTVKQ